MSPMEVQEILQLYDLNQTWNIFGSVALDGVGLYEGLDWLASVI